MDHKYANSNSIFGIYIRETSGRDTYRYVEMTATLKDHIFMIDNY